jgi:hypothetical protein
MVERNASKQNRFEVTANCFFKGAGNSNLPLASTLHSYVPIIASTQVLNDVEQKYKKYYHYLPLSTTLLISLTTFDKTPNLDNQIISRFYFFVRMIII